MASSDVWPAPEHQATGPLAGIRVLDLSAFAVGPWAACLLGALGADVVKVDPVYGDHIRAVKPTRKGEATTYTICNLGKRNIELDLKEPAHRRQAQQMASVADIVLENSREGAMSRLQMDYPTLRRFNPQLVYVASSSFGSTGPLATVGSTDPQGQAFSGFVDIQGARGGQPEFLRYFAAIDLGTSLYLAQAALIGVYWRDRTGRGCEIKTSQMEGAMALQMSRIAEHLVAGQTPTPLGSESAAFAPSAAYACRDKRHLNVSAHDDRTWRRLCDALGVAGLADDPRFASNRLRVEHRADLNRLLGQYFLEADTTWWRQQLDARRVPNSVQLALDDLMRNSGPGVLTQHLMTLPHPTDGTMQAVKPIWDFERTPARYGPAPVPGQHNDLFRADSGGDDWSRDDLVVADDESTEAPLEGVSVVEISQGLSGPYCGLLAAELGATVTKVEPEHGDFSRDWAPAVEGGVSAAFAGLNRGKILLRASGRPDRDDAVRAAIAGADVVVVDDDVVDFGFTAVDDLLAALDVPDSAIVCRVNAVGRNEDGSSVPATELELQALTGLNRYVGALDEAPIRVGADIVSTISGAVSLQAVLAGLIEREKSSRGQRVDVSSVRSMLAVLCVMVAALDKPEEWGGFHCLAAAYPRDYGVTTSDGAISFSSPKRSDAEWVALCDELGAGQLGRAERYATDALRTPRSKELNRELSMFTGKLDKQSVLEATHRHGGLGVAVQSYQELFAHPQALAMDVVEVTGDHEWLAAPWRLNGKRPQIAHGVVPPHARETTDGDSASAIPSDFSTSPSVTPTDL